MRKTILACAAASAALVLFAASPASAVGISYSWQPASGNFSTAANWDPAAIPGTDDLLVFNHGTSAFNDLPGSIDFRSLTFNSPDGPFLLDGAADFGLRQGITAATDAVIDQDIRLVGPQAWWVASDHTLEVTGTVTSGGQSLILMPEERGIIEFSVRLDPQATGQVIKTAAGAVVLSGSGGTTLFGYQQAEGITHVTGELTGTDFVVTGGVLSGGGPGALDGALLTLRIEDGVVSPGVQIEGGDVATLKVWNGFTANGGSYTVSVDGTASDLIDVYQSATLAGTELNVLTDTEPAVGTALHILHSETGTVTGQFAFGGVALAEGDEFESNGHIYAIDYEAQDVFLVYVGAASVPPATPPAPTLPSTGVDTTAPGLVGVAFLLLGLTAAGYAARRRA